jgi:hypothetical protein
MDEHYMIMTLFEGGKGKYDYRMCRLQECNELATYRKVAAAPSSL